MKEVLARLWCMGLHMRPSRFVIGASHMVIVAHGHAPRTTVIIDIEVCYNSKIK